jgi:biotin carboxylase
LTPVPGEHRLLVLGAGRHQAPLIERAERRGICTIALDPYPDSPGKRVASVAADGDALDADRVLEVARRHHVDGIVTIGTDQPVLVMAQVAAAMGLPCHLDEVGALAATNKAAMGPALRSADVPMPQSVTIDPGTSHAEAELPDLPCVVKAADSQGQRGMSIVRSTQALRAAIIRAREASRTATVVVEHFHEGPEFTINAWISAGEALFAIALDRITVNPPPSIGICLQHVYPSVHARDEPAFRAIAEAVARAYGMQRGPLYIQTIASSDGYRVIEAASRVGGGHEAQLLPRIMTLDLVDRTIDLALGRPEAPLDIQHKVASGLVNFIVTSPGKLAHLGDFAKLVADGTVDEGAWYVEPGHEQGPIVDSMDRIGYFIVTAPGRSDTLERAGRAYHRLRASDPTEKNLVTWPDGSILNQPADRF